MFAKPNKHFAFDKPVRFISEQVLFKSKSRICYSIENFEYGMREFAIYDNNGYLLQPGCEKKDP